MPPAQQYTIKYERTLGMTVMEGKGFYCPNDMAFGPDDRIYVLNRSTEAISGKGMRVAVCDENDEYYGSFGTFGQGRGEFVWPSAIAVGPDNRIYISDEHLQKILVFNSDGGFITEWGCFGDDAGKLDTPSGLAINAEGNLIISDTYNHRIQMFSLEGSFIKTFGTYGCGDGELNMPWRLSFGPDSNIYVADWGNNRVSIFTQEGDFITSLGEVGTENAKFDHPADVVSDSNGHIYVCDWGNERVQVLDSKGEFLQLTMGESTLSPWANNFFNVNVEEAEARSKANLENFDIELPDPNDRHIVSAHIEKFFWAPMALAIRHSNKLFVLESNRHRIQIFKISY